MSHSRISRGKGGAIVAIQLPGLEDKLVVFKGGTFVLEVLESQVILEGVIAFLGLYPEEGIRVDLAEGEDTVVSVNGGNSRGATGYELHWNIPIGDESCAGPGNKKDGKLHFEWQDKGRHFVASIGPPKPKKEDGGMAAKASKSSVPNSFRTKFCLSERTKSRV